MKIVGTICEYNPFHNGHLYALKKIREIAKPDILIVCLSTYFTMRGDLSLHLPKRKAAYALKEADIVVALPSLLAVNSASIFANNAVRELAKLNVSEIYCGSESADLSYIKNISFAEDELQQQLALHKSYKKATATICDIKPNDLLAFAYHQAIKENNYPIELKLIARIGDGHDSKVAFDNLYTSSKAIRNNHELFKNYCPDYVDHIHILDYDALFPYLKFQLLNNSLPNHPILDNGLAKHIYNSVQKTSSMQELLVRATNSYFTTTKIKRAIFYLLFHIDDFKEDYQYSKILGFSSKGQKYLNDIKSQTNLITNTKSNISSILDYELKIANILDYIFPNQNILQAELDKPIII